MFHHGVEDGSVEALLAACDEPLDGCETPEAARLEALPWTATVE
jgi:hypothetical protein